MNEKLVNAAQVAQKEVAALQEKMDLAAKMYQAGREAEGAVLLQEAAVLTRNMSDRYRDLLMSSGNPDYAARLEQIMAEVHPVQIGFTEQGWFGIRMEPLALDRETASKEYIPFFPSGRRSVPPDPVQTIHEKLAGGAVCAGVLFGTDALSEGISG